MQINIQARGFTLTDGLREHTSRRLQFALGWAGHHLGRVSVRLSDENGPRGGKDKRCHIRLVLPGTKEVVVEDTETDLYVAIDRATARAGRSVTHRLERQRDHRHGPLPEATSSDGTALPL
ncbi:MAG: HPF/RaiA family ribosome-associated protein [Candidatus Competibacteraceae bacterium]